MPHATATELGIDRKEIHEGRKLKAAEEADPGVIQHSIGATCYPFDEPLHPAPRSVGVGMGRNGERVVRRSLFP